MPRTLRLLVVAAVAAAAIGPAPTASAAPPDPAIATIGVTPGGAYAMAAGLGAMWAARTDEVNTVLVYRIDPRTNRARQVRELKFPGASMNVGFGSLWITDYYGNAVYRLSPRGKVQARIPTGLQPEAVHLAFGSVWVANHHGQSLTRIDPRTDRVVATAQAGEQSAFRDGPQGMTDDGHRLYVGSSNLPSLQSVNPRTNATTTSTTTTDDTFCGSLVWLAGHVWSQDNCTQDLYQFAPDGTLTTTVPLGTTSDSDEQLGLVRFRHQLWDVVDKTYDPDTQTGSDAALERRDVQSGAVVESTAIDGDAGSGVFAGFGSLWVPDAHAGVIRRVTPTR